MQSGSQFGLHPVQIAHWRRTALDHIEDLFVEHAGEFARRFLGLTLEAYRRDRITKTMWPPSSYTELIASDERRVFRREALARSVLARS